MLMTFFNVPLLSSGRNALVTICTLVTLALKISFRSSTAYIPGQTYCLDAGIVDQYVETLAMEMLLDFRHSSADTWCASAIELDEYDTVGVSVDQILQGSGGITAGRSKNGTDLGVRQGDKLLDEGKAQAS